MNSSQSAGACLCASLLAFTLPVSICAGELPDGLYAVFHTKHGAITAELFPDKAPLTVANFVGLAEGTIPFEGRPPGTPFYDGLVFHRVAPGFVVQGGDPLGTGEGGPGYSFADEFNPAARHVRGALAMANSGPNTNGSQFYFAIEEVHRLNYKHTVFGEVREGMDVITAIGQGDAMDRVEIIRVGDAAGAFRPSQEQFESLRAAARVLLPRDTALAPLFANDSGLEMLPWFPQWTEEKLNHYHQITGTQIFVRLFRKFSEIPGGSRQALSALFATLSAGDERACLLVFLEDEQSWRLWFGNGVLARIGHSGGGADTEPGKSALHAAKLAVLAPAKARIEEGNPRRSIDAAVTSLIEFLDGTPAPR